MKYLIIILIIITQSFAGSLFWENVNNIEKEFYQVVFEKNDKNTTYSSEDMNTLLDKKHDLFYELLKILKQQPYDLKLENDFENKNDSIMKFKEKININESHGNNLAVIRDKINIENIILKNKIKKYFITMADKRVSFDENSVKNINKEYKEYLTSIKYMEYLDLYNRIKLLNGDVESETKENFTELNKHYKFFNDVLDYIEANQSLLAYKSLTSFLKLDIIIESINSNIIFAQINPYLRFVYTDIGRLALFFMILLIFFLINYVVYKIIYGYIKKILLLKHNEISENILENLDNIRRPISVIVIILGFKLALEVLVYPNNLNDQISNIFYLIIVIFTIYIINIIIDIFLYSYLVINESTTETIRKELIMFSKSIIKVIIFLTVFLLFLMEMDVNISAVLASLGIGGLAVALAAQTTLSNFFGLLKMIFDDSFSQGDWIETTDVQGTVVEIGFISTTVRTFDNAMITIPNATLANSPIKNWSRRKLGRRVKMHIGVTYSSTKQNLHNAISQIESMLIEHNGVATEQEVDYNQINRNYKKQQRLISVDDKYGVKSRIFVYLDQLSDSSMDILVDFFTKDTEAKEWLKIKEDVIFKIWDILEENELEFAFPSQSIYIKEKGILSSSELLTGIEKN